MRNVTIITLKKLFGYVFNKCDCSVTNAQERLSYVHTTVVVTVVEHEPEGSRKVVIAVEKSSQG